MPKLGKRIIGKSDTTPNGRASFVQSVTSRATIPIKSDWVAVKKNKLNRVKTTPINRAITTPLNSNKLFIKIPLCYIEEF